MYLRNRKVKIKEMQVGLELGLLDLDLDAAGLDSACKRDGFDFGILPLLKPTLSAARLDPDGTNSSSAGSPLNEHELRSPFAGKVVRPENT